MNGPRAKLVVQFFTDDYLERCRQLSPVDIVRFLEDYRELFGAAKVRTTVRLEDCETDHPEPEPFNPATERSVRPNGIGL